jgi:hypothetical protein
VHGFIFSELQRYVIEAHDEATWRELVRRAGTSTTDFENFLEYPDGDALALVQTASEMTGVEPGAILMDFGAFLGRQLVRVYRPLIDPSWKTLDVLLNTEQTIHRIVRSRNKQARPPVLRFTREGPSEVMLHYASQRKLCPLAKGIIQGLAENYGEQVTMRDESCMLNGDSECRVRVTRTG